MIEVLEESLREASQDYDPTNEVPPACLLWTDADGQWEPVVELLRARLPQLFTVGHYAPELRSGPAIWLKCIVARTEDVDLPASVVPILYLPKVGRQALRSGVDCPIALQPLIELQYRGLVWTQVNGKDWTLEAFLVSNDGLGLEVAKDERTRNSLKAAAAKLALTRVSELSHGRLAWDDFDRLLVEDEAREVLEWFGDPEGLRKAWGENRYLAFSSRCQERYGFHPEKDGEVRAAELLGMQEIDAWKQLWRRYCESPARYPRIRELLLRAKPSGRLIFNKEPWPDENEREEESLFTALQELPSLQLPAARERIRELESGHAVRRSWVWAALGLSELAVVLETLAALSEKSAVPLGGSNLEQCAIEYTTAAFLVDSRAREALSKVGSQRLFTLIREVVRTFYVPWLEKAVEHFQNLAKREDYVPFHSAKPIEVKSSETLLFVDGLRYDLAEELKSALEELGMKVESHWRFSAQPSITSTCKPAVSPVAKLLRGNSEISETLSPQIQQSGDTLNHARFQRLLGEEGFTLVSTQNLGEPSSQKGWCEFGQIDPRGHDLQGELVRHLSDEVSRIVEHVRLLFEHGWKKLTVITDHGWLLLPGGLPKTQLPAYLIETKGARAAMIKGESQVAVPTVPWFWNPQKVVAVAPGISAFHKGVEYAHGGLSPQECVIPELTIEPGRTRRAAAPKIKTVQWLNLRCRIAVSPVVEGLIADIRKQSQDPNSSVTTGGKPVPSDGQLSLLVNDDSFLGGGATIVILHVEGKVLHKESTILGE